jgi:nitroreductase
VEVIKAIRTRRSIRQYLPKDISKNELETVLEAARWAPSWANTQCTRFVIVRDKKIRRKLAASLHTGNPAIPALNQAPLIIVVCAELGKSGFHEGGNVTHRDDWKVSITGKGDWYMFDTALAMQNMALAAHAIGLGTVLIGGFNPGEVGKILNVPRGVEVVAMTPLGYPTNGTKQSSRRGLSETVFMDEYSKRFI